MKGLILLLAIVIGSMAVAQKQEELGKVDWLRDFDQAIAQSKEEGKPILILFQEVPGCSTCRNYGHDVLSDPLLADVIENEFVPLAVFNNKGGKDMELLEKFSEPAWNNPVVRIIDATSKELAPRVSGNYSAIGLQEAMITALQAHNAQVPDYLALLHEEMISAQQNLQYATYSMFCFWSGAKHFGNVKGVLNTEAGFENGHEVVKVSFDPTLVTKAELDAHAEKGKCDNSQGQEFRLSKKNTFYYLRNSAYRYVPMTLLQRTRINALLGNRKDARHLLSPTQLKFLDNGSIKEVVFDLELRSAWPENFKS